MLQDVTRPKDIHTYLTCPHVITLIPPHADWRAVPAHSSRRVRLLISDSPACLSLGICSPWGKHEAHEGGEQERAAGDSWQNRNSVFVHVCLCATPPVMSSCASATEANYLPVRMFHARVYVPNVSTFVG